MLPREKNGVVDANLCVYGTKNVRIADLSVVPLHVASHTQSKCSLLSSSQYVCFVVVHLLIRKFKVLPMLLESAHPI